MKLRFFSPKWFPKVLETSSLATETGAIRRGGATATAGNRCVGVTTAEVVVMDKEMAL